MKRFFTKIAKWTWFAVLVLVAFGYMASGLSDPNRGPNVGDEELNASASPASLESASARSIEAASNADTISYDAGNASTEDVVQAVNQARLKMISDVGLTSADQADWLTVCRRMSLSLVGSGMSLQEIRALEQLPEDERKSSHLQNLFRDARFHDYWAERWTRFLVGADEGPFIVYRRRRFRHWLSDSIAANRPYDQIVSDLVTAEGLWTDKPQVNFLTVTFDSNDGNPDPVRLAARTCRAFLGLRIDCLQCHNDFLGNVNLGDPKDPREGQQTDFHGLAAFYSAAKTNGLQGVRTGDADYEYKFLEAEEEAPVPAAVPYAQELLPEEGDPRWRLAKWITHPENRQFSRASVVRFWSLMFGMSPTEAVDNLPLDEPIPSLLEPIVDDFVEHRDIRRAIEIIALSDAFGADSRCDFEVTEAHEEVHAVFPLTRLRAEQVAASIAQASRIKSINRKSSLLVQFMKFGSINDFLKRYGDLGENEFSDDGITIPQRLVMLNGNMLHEAGQANPVLNTSSHINMFASSDASAVDTAFLCLLNRHPGDEEKEYFVSRVTEANNREKALEDLFWTLANSSEFAWYH